MKAHLPSSPLTAIAIKAAQEAGALLRKGFGTKIATKSKPGISNFVTAYDEAAETIIRNILKDNFPTHGFIGEESGENSNKAEQITWVVDPLDGTHNFSRGLPIFAVSIAAVQNNIPLLGVIYQPITAELFVAERGKGSFLGGEKLQVSEVNQLKDAFLVTGFPYYMEKNPHNFLETYQKFIQEGYHIREIGSAALSLAYLAAGKFDAFWAPMLESWDVAAGMLILEEAGGKISHYGQQTFDLFAKGTVLASNDHLHGIITKRLL